VRQLRELRWHIITWMECTWQGNGAWRADLMHPRSLSFCEVAFLTVAFMNSIC